MENPMNQSGKILPLLFRDNKALNRTKPFVSGLAYASPAPQNQGFAD